MYDELLKRLRAAAIMSEALSIFLPHSEGSATAKLYNEAADAIEELMDDNAALNGTVANLLEQIKDLGKPKWISVEERLPEENGRYLVRYKRDIVLDYTEVHDDEVRIMRFFVDDGWRYPFLCQPKLRKAEQQTVTHWMVLPNLPAEENANG